MTPQIGLPIQYVRSDGKIKPAVVYEVDSPASDKIRLVYWQGGISPEARTTYAPFSETAVPNTWHYIPS